jgi:hypothetical protein
MRLLHLLKVRVCSLSMNLYISNFTLHKVIGFRHATNHFHVTDLHVCSLTCYIWLSLDRLQVYIYIL